MVSRGVTILTSGAKGTQSKPTAMTVHRNNSGLRLYFTQPPRQRHLERSHCKNMIYAFSSYCHNDTSATDTWSAPFDITAPLPAAMYSDWVRIYDNGNSNVSQTPNYRCCCSLSSPGPIAMPVPVSSQSPVAATVLASAKVNIQGPVLVPV